MKRSKIDKNLSLSYISTGNLDISQENKSKSQHGTSFKFESKKILHLWLAAVIPGPRSSALKYDIQNKKIYGQKKQCDKMISLCDHFLQNRKLKIIYGLSIDYNTQLYLQYKIDANIYTRQQVEQSCHQLINHFNLFQLEKEAEVILKRKNYVLVSIDQRNEDKLQQVLDFIKNNVITRSIINQAKNQSLKSNRSMTQIQLH